MSNFRHVSLLLVEDNPGDAHLIRYNLGSEMLISFNIVHVVSLALAINALQHGKFDAVLLELDLPDSSGLDTLRILAEESPDLPVIVLVHRDDIDLGIKAMHAGAQDFQVKGHFDGIQLRRSILYAEHHKKAYLQLDSLHRQNELILRSVGDGIAGLDSLGRMSFINPRLEIMTGWSASDLMLQSPDDVFHPLKMDETHIHHRDSPIATTLMSGQVHEVCDVMIRCKDGHLLPVDIVVTPVLENGFVNGAIAAFHDARDRHHALEMLTSQLGFQQQVIDALPFPIFYLDSMDILIGCNRAFLKLTSRKHHHLLGLHIQDVLPHSISEVITVAQHVGPPKQQIVATIDDDYGRTNFLKLAHIFGQDATIIGMVGVLDQPHIPTEQMMAVA
ncbi:MAG: PAS domain-containing protein [Alphaproteobacteria bacterium]|nr:PAS domain-containing protein [Alphaproteobacteria bacterium]